MNELTEWYPADIKPIYRGTYEVQVLGVGKFYSWWTGCAWLQPFIHKEWSEQRRNSTPLAMKQNRQWRGLKAPAQ